MQILADKTYREKFVLMILSNTAILSLVLLIHHQNATRITPSFIERISTDQHSIPKIVHFVVGQVDQKGVKRRYASTTPFSFFNYLVFLAARIQIQPRHLFVHYYEEPTTFWWNQSKKDPEIQMILVKSRLVENIFSKSIDHHAHRSDVLRLEILLQHGGIYLDTDALAFRSFDHLLNLSDVVMANQDDDKKSTGNSIILAKKNSMFLKRWYDAYQSFDSNCWACHSVLLPGQLASLYPNEIQLLPAQTFYKPGWRETQKFFHENTYNFTSNYASHMWNKINEDHLSKLTPRSIFKMNNTFGRMVRYAIGEKRLRQLEDIDFD